MSVPVRIIVAGGGIGGLTAARALLDAGMEVVVLERRDLTGMRGGPGGIFIQKNAMRVFEALDGGSVARRLYEEGGKVLDGGFFDVGHRPLYINRPSFAGEPDLGVAILRPDLQRVLFEALPAGVVRAEAAFAGYRLDGAEVVVELASGEELRGDVLVGADGLRSRVRARLAGQERGEPPLYSGQTCWRGRFQRGQAPLDERYTWGELWSVGTRFGYFDTGRGNCCFYGFSNEPEGGEDESGPIRALRARFGHFASPVPEIIDSLDESTVYRDDIYDRDPPGPVWGKGPVTLLGDAAHPSQPTLGQGGCMAIEDAFELARLLRRGRDAGRPVAAVLREYEALRAPRVGRVVTDSRNVAKLANTESRWVAKARDWMYRLMPPQVGDWQFRWLFDYRPAW
jgi:2-polyprenyl-6-methoxyphenol hydroxylase-like FAD-dependent oxidoreductase